MVEVFTNIENFSDAGATYSMGAKLDLTRTAARLFHERFRSGPTVKSLRTLDLITFPYPTRFGLWQAAISPAPYVMMTNRALLVQFTQLGELKTLLMNPTDYRASETAPYFQAQLKKYGKFLVDNLLTKKFKTIDEHLQELGVVVDKIDYIAFDHLHVQDLKNLMGTVGVNARPPRFPKAKFLFHRAEVESMKNLHPLQRPWYVPGALDGVVAERQVLVENDLMLGDGVALLQTPGHTAGNMSLVLNTPEGVLVTSENGISVDSYCPEKSAIAGLRRYAKTWNVEVILNANTIEYTAEQYNSMIKEKLVAGEDQLGLPNFFPSSELTSSWLAPMLSPTFTRCSVNFGELKI
ncbi:MAG: hypothetical protein JNN15_05570 [Blastocatellia bacterium]|nr:hypothetical protein [Blastocatellia bacterium]